MLLVLPISQHREPRTADKKLHPVKTVVTSVSGKKLLQHYFYKTILVYIFVLRQKHMICW